MAVIVVNVAGFQARFRGHATAAATADDRVSTTTDGRRLDSKEKVLAVVAELEAERAAAAKESDDGDCS